MKRKINSILENDIDLWEERKLGATDENVQVASDEEMQEFNEAISLQLISIRLEKKLIADLKSIAESYHIGYQPMIRDLLHRFVISEKKMKIKALLEELSVEENERSDTEAIDNFIKFFKEA